MHLGQTETVSTGSWMDTLNKAVDTLVKGGVQYTLNKQAAKTGQSFDSPAQTVVVPDTSNRNMLLAVAAGLGGLLLFMNLRKKRR